MNGSDWIGENERRRSGRNCGPTAFHGGAMARLGYLTIQSTSSRKKHRMIENINANSPRVKSRAWDRWRWRCARYGGRWWRGRVSSSRWCHGSTADATKGMDEGGYARHPCLYSPKALRVRKEEDLARDSMSAKKESDASDGLMKEATLTTGSAMLATGREGKHARALAGPVVARWARPQRERGERRVGHARGEKQMRARITGL
jgi:hypothetical protein